jgi:hypothetical protein
MSTTKPFDRPIDPDAPAFAHDLRRVRNPPPAYFHCLCGGCSTGEEARYDDFAIDACLHTAQEMLGGVEKCLPPGDVGGYIALQSAGGLLINARLMLCMQRQAARSGESGAL